MHNPSTADAEGDDPTIRRCIGFSRSWGFGGIYVGNIFPYRATDPKDLLGLPIFKLVPPCNIEHISEMAALCHLLILAYGNPVRKEYRPIFIDDTWHILKLTKQGNPCHPLYLKGELQPSPYISDFFNPARIKHASQGT